jgi:MFS family permease
MTTSITLIGDYFEEEERHKYMALQGMSVGIGGILFITLGGFLAEITWSYPFAIYLLPILFLPYLLIHMHEPQRHKHPKTSQSRATLWPIYLSGFLVMVLFYMLPTQFPYLIINQLGGTPSDVGLIIATSMFINALTAMQYARLRKHLSFEMIFVIVLAVFGCGLLIISHATSILELYASTLFMGMGFGLMFVNLNAWLLSKVEVNNRGKASGMLTSAIFLGQFFSPILFQPIIEMIGIQGLFMSIAILVWGVATMLWLFLKRRSV